MTSAARTNRNQAALLPRLLAVAEKRGATLDLAAHGNNFLDPVQFLRVQPHGHAQFPQIALGTRDLDFSDGQRDDRFRLHSDSPEFWGLSVGLQPLKPFDPHQYDFRGILGSFHAP